MEGPGPEEYFQGSEPVLKITFNIGDMKSKGLADAKSVSDLGGSPVVKDILTRVLNSIDPQDREKVETTLLSGDSCEWQQGPCGSCYDTYTRYAYAINCGNGWEYGCGYCT